MEKERYKLRGMTYKTATKHNGTERTEFGGKIKIKIKIKNNYFLKQRLLCNRISILFSLLRSRPIEEVHGVVHDTGRWMTQRQDEELIQHTAEGRTGEAGVYVNSLTDVNYSMYLRLSLIHI